MNLSSHSAVTLISNLPVINISLACKKVLNRNCRTIGLRNAENEIDVLLIAPSGQPIAIVDFHETSAVRKYSGLVIENHGVQDAASKALAEVLNRRGTQP